MKTLLIYSGLLFSGLSRSNFKSIKKRYKLGDKVQIHHIIPREFKYHPVISFSEYEIENGYNMMFLPTYKGLEKLKLHSDRPIHESGHTKYNSYVGSILDKMLKDEKYYEDDMCLLNIHLKENMRHLNIPWK